MRLTGTCVLVLTVFAFAMPAYAGNGNGNGTAGATQGAPGNSANAPGQEKKNDAAASPAATTTTAADAAPAAAPTEGVKPSNETAHETHASAQSNDTKLYGNGHNAGEIAMANGASGSTRLHGPGNSQPHKAAPCSGGHERDVHALKGRHAAACGNTPTPSPPPHGNNPPSVVTETKKPTPADPAPQPLQPSGGEAPAVEATHRGGQGDTQGVLSATQRAGRVAALPFTGQNLWIVVLAAIALISTGIALRQIRTVEALVESGHDHTDRARHSAHSSRSSVGGCSGR